MERMLIEEAKRNAWYAEENARLRAIKNAEEANKEGMTEVSETEVKELVKNGTTVYSFSGEIIRSIVFDGSEFVQRYHREDGSIEEEDRHRSVYMLLKFDSMAYSGFYR